MPSDHHDAAETARAAGELLMELRRSSGLAGKELSDLGDHQSDAVIHEMLARRHPADALFSEESADDAARLDAARVWIIDPLDGSREYGEGRDDWAVHVALVIAHEVVAAAVALPALELVLSTSPAPVLPPRPGGTRLRLVASRTRPPAMLEGVAARLGAEIIPMGSAGAKTMAVVRGEADAYVHAGGQFEWDSAAPVGVAAAAGLHVSRLDGTPLRYNQRDPWLPDQLVCRPELAAPVLDALCAST